MTEPTRRPRRSLLRKATGPAPAGVGTGARRNDPIGASPGADAAGDSVIIHGDEGYDVLGDDSQTPDDSAAAARVSAAAADVAAEPVPELAAAFSPTPSGPRPTLVPAPQVDSAVRAPGREQGAAAPTASPASSPNLMWPVLFGLGLVVIGIVLVLMLGLGGILFSDANIGSTPGIGTARQTTQE